jgi:hypothetical protein
MGNFQIPGAMKLPSAHGQPFGRKSGGATGKVNRNDVLHAALLREMGGGDKKSDTGKAGC